MAKGIFIEGMKKPKECSRLCPFAESSNYDCVLIPDAVWINSFVEQYERCPLREVEIPSAEQ